MTNITYDHFLEKDEKVLRDAAVKRLDELNNMAASNSLLNTHSAMPKMPKHGFVSGERSDSQFS